MTDELTFDFDAVTPRMLIDFKEKTGASLLDFADKEVKLDALDEVVVAGFIWIAMRMSGNPGATWDDALDTPFTALNIAEVPDEGATDPTPAG